MSYTWNSRPRVAALLMCSTLTSNPRRCPLRCSTVRPVPSMRVSFDHLNAPDPSLGRQPSSATTCELELKAPVGESDSGHADRPTSSAQFRGEPTRRDTHVPQPWRGGTAVPCCNHECDGKCWARGSPEWNVCGREPRKPSVPPHSDRTLPDRNRAFRRKRFR